VRDFVSASPTSPASRELAWLLPLFAGSGCAALMYEVIWFQSLALIVGSSAVSMAVVLATFMGGMGLGSLAYLRWHARVVHPLRTYAQLELLIAAFGLLVLYVLPWAGGLYTAIGGGGLGGILLRGLFCALFLLPPTMAMGATLPAAAGWVRASPAGVTWIGLFYAANIAGGVFGSLWVVFHLLRVHDSRVATFVAVCLNLVVASIAATLARRAPAGAAVAAGPSASGSLPPVSGSVLVAIAVSGACALGAEVVWTRNLALLLGGTVYTFALILAAMLLGLGIGSSLGAATARHSARPRRALALCQLLAALGLAWAAWWQTEALPKWPVNPQLASSVWFQFQLDFVRCLWAVLPAALCWGASFPLALAAVAVAETRGSHAVARVYAANTAGAIAGALLVGLVMIAWLGTQQTQRLLITLAAMAALLVYLPVPRVATAPGGLRASAWPPLAFSAALLLVALAAVRPVNGVLVGHGRAAAIWQRIHGEFIYVGEGLNSSLAISRFENGVVSYHNAGKVQASSEPRDMRVQRLLGHLTTLLARDPKRVLVIGCGAGVTAGAVGVNPAVERETIVEIERLVPWTTDRYFSAHNHDVIRNPKVEVRIDDARHYLLTSDENFDAITADPFDTWVKGAAMLSTVEFLEEMRRHLNPGGVVTVWMQFYETDLAAIKSELATFLQVFPHAMLFGNTFGGKGYDGVLVGSPEPLRIDVDELAERLQRPEYAPVVASLAEVGYGGVDALLGTFAAEGTQLAAWLADAQINSDRNLRLQYLAGFASNQFQQASIYREILRHGGWRRGVFTGSAERLAALRSAVLTRHRRASSTVAVPRGGMTSSPGLVDTSGSSPM
jgi:spermidine synthase